MKVNCFKRLAEKIIVKVFERVVAERTLYVPIIKFFHRTGYTKNSSHSINTFGARTSFMRFYEKTSIVALGNIIYL